MLLNKKKLLKNTKSYKIWYDPGIHQFSIEMLTTFFIDKDLTDSIPKEKLELFIKSIEPTRPFCILYEIALNDLIECIKKYKIENKEVKEYFKSLFEDEDNDFIDIQPAPSSPILVEESAPVFKIDSYSFTNIEDIEKLYAGEK